MSNFQEMRDLNINPMTVAEYTEEDLDAMEEFDDEVARIQNFLDECEDEVEESRLDEIERELSLATSTLNASAREFQPSPSTLLYAQSLIRQNENHGIFYFCE